MKTLIYIFFLSLCLTQISFGQNTPRDHGIFIEPKNEFMDSVKKEAERFKKKEEKPAKTFKLDFSTIQHPNSPDEFTKYWHTPPVSQALTSTCWCFSTTSFFESEVYRLNKREIKLSEMYTVYWEYVEKAKRFIQEQGNSVFAEGSESDAVPRIWKKYGIVPENVYDGLQKGQLFHDHGQLFAEMNNYLQSVKNTNAWNEDAAISTIKAILNRYLGEPPASFTVDGKKMTPKEYFVNVVKLNLDDYVSLISLMDKPYYHFGEYEVSDNWWHSTGYYYIPLDDYMKVVKNAIRKGFTICIGGDVSEAGYEGHAGIGVIPTFDIPAEYIDENARQFRFSNGSTGDDHGIHVVGYLEKDGKDWYLIKDSGSGSRNNSHPGYYFYREDYIKLKMVDLMVHKDAIKNIVTVTEDK
jgi:bleomycin hydrolase